MYNTLTLLASVLAGNGPNNYGAAYDAALHALADLVVSHGVDLDLTDAGPLSELLNYAVTIGGLAVDTAVVDGAATIAAALNQAAADAGGAAGVGLLSALSAIALVAQGAAATALKDVGDGLSNIASAVAGFSGDNLSNAISDAKYQTGDVDGPGIANAPVATADSYATNVNVALHNNAPGLLGNDTDADGDGLTASLVLGPAHALAFTFNADGSFDYTPELDYIGPDQFTYLASDGFGESNVVSVSIDVQNGAPVFTTLPLFEVSENEQAVTNVTAIDPQDHDVVFALAGGADQAFFSIDAQSGALSFVFSPDFETPEDADHDNVYEVMVSASDPFGATTTQAISVGVTDIVEIGRTIKGGNGNQTLFGNTGNDKIGGGNGHDWLGGGDGNDTLSGGNGNDVLIGDRGHDILEGGNGYDLLDGGKGDDHLFGGNGDDVLLGGDGNNWLDGDNGDDIISAGNGGNTLVGGNGNDVFYLGSGDNTLWGGNGKDVFSFPAEFGRNVIGDFGKGDSIECSSARFADFQALQAAMQQVGADTVIALDTEHFVILQDVIVRNLHESDFHLL